MRFLLQWFQFLSQSDTVIFGQQKKTEVKSDNVTYYCLINYQLYGLTSLPNQNTEEPFSKDAASFSQHPQPLSKFHQVSRHQSADVIESVDTGFYFQPIRTSQASFGSQSFPTHRLEKRMKTVSLSKGNKDNTLLHSKGPPRSPSLI